MKSIADTSSLLIAVLLIFSGCMVTSDKTLATDTVDSGIKEITPNTTGQMPTMTYVAAVSPSVSAVPTAAPSETPTITPSSTLFIGIQKQCIPDENTISVTVNESGVLVLSSLETRNLYTLKIGGNSLAGLPGTEGQLGNNEFWAIDISPDNHWVAYHKFSNNGVKGPIQFYSVGDTAKNFYIPWNNGWNGLRGWLNNQEIIVAPVHDKDILRDEIFIINPFSGEIRNFAQTFTSGLNFDFPEVFYNANLSKAIYRSGGNFILWDVSLQQDIWRRGGAYHISPQWSPDDNVAAAALITKEDLLAHITHQDLYMVDSQGQETQLTRLSEYFPDVEGIYIDQFKWSPNGKYIAFSFVLQHNSKNVIYRSLAIVNINTKEIVDYCLPAIFEGGPITWLPDSQQLLVGLPKDLNQYNTTQDRLSSPVKIVLIDIGKKALKMIWEDYVIVGWLGAQ